MAMLPHDCVYLSGAFMVAKDTDVFRRQARVLKALANESRLKIVDRLSRGECSVGELTEMIGSDPSTVSKHLAVLRAHGIVRDRRQGNVVYYTLLTPSWPTRRSRRTRWQVSCCPATSWSGKAMTARHKLPPSIPGLLRLRLPTRPSVSSPKKSMSDLVVSLRY